MGGMVDLPEDCAAIQRDLDKQSPAPGEEKPQAPIYAEGHTAGKQLSIKGPGGLDRHQDEPEPAVCPCSEEGEWYLYLH